MQHDDNFFSKLVGDVKSETHYKTYNDDLEKLLNNKEIKKMVKVAIVKKVGEPVSIPSVAQGKTKDKITQEDLALEEILMDE